MALLTVLLPVYNGAQHLAAALDCILNQTFQEFECLVIDDGSEDGSTEIVRSYTDPRIRLVCRPHSGLGATLDYGVRVCSSPLIARMDADDLCSPNRLFMQVAYLGRNAQIGALGTQFKYFGGAGVSVPSRRLPLDHDTIRRDLLKGDLALCHASLIMRTSLLIEAGGYRIKGIGEDWDMFLRLTERTKVANLGDIFYYWRLHNSNINYKKTLTEQLGIEYAKYCAGTRNCGMAEVDFADFIRQRRHRLSTAISDASNALALVQYRQALSELSENKRLLCGFRMAAGSALAPRRAARRLWQMVTGPQGSSDY